MNATDEMNKFSCTILRNVELTYPIFLPRTKSYDIAYIAVFLASVLVIISTICLNSVTVFVYWKVSQLRKKVTHFMIMLLSLSDLGMGMMTLPFFTILQGKKALKESPPVRSVWHTSTYIFVTMSLSILFTMAID